MDFNYQPFASLLAEIVDNRGKTCPTAPTGTPLIATNCISNSLLYPAYEKVRFVDKKTYDTWFRGHPTPGDLLFVTKGTPGRVCMVPSPVDFCIAQDMVAIRADEKKIYPKYLFAVLRTDDVQKQIEQLHVGTLIPHFKKGDFDKLILPIPDWQTQIFVGDLYFNFSAKIDLNRQMNETLEAMARAIFKSWFVDFDPVRAKAEGRDTGLPEEIAELFPDSFEETEVGEVPKGWKYCSAETVADVGIGKTPPRKESEWFSTNPDDIRWASIRDMGESGTYILDTTEYLTSEAVDKFNIRLVPNNTVLLSFKLTIGRVTLTDGEITTNEAIAHFKLYDEFHLSNEYLYLYLQKFDYTKLGSTSSIAQAVNSKTIKAMPILVPEESVITEFTGRFVSIFDKIKMNQRESRTLAELRDTLLPKLISGELRVNDLKINMEAMQ